MGQFRIVLGSIKIIEMPFGCIGYNLQCHSAVTAADISMGSPNWHSLILGILTAVDRCRVTVQMRQKSDGPVQRQCNNRGYYIALYPHVLVGLAVADKFDADKE